MFFFMGGAIAGAHRSFFHAPALTDTDTPQRHAREVPDVFRKLEVRFMMRGTIVSSEAQVFHHIVGVDLFARIHFPGWVPNRLELTKGFDQFGSKQLWQKPAARLSIPMFAGE